MPKLPKLRECIDCRRLPARQTNPRDRDRKLPREDITLRYRCPGCGRRTRWYYPHLERDAILEWTRAHAVWRGRIPGVNT